MKRNLVKRMIAFMLCMVLVLGSSTSAFADDVNSENANTAEAVQGTGDGIAALSETDDSSDETPQVEAPKTETPAAQTEQTTEPKAEETEEETSVKEPETPKTPDKTPETPENSGTENPEGTPPEPGKETPVDTEKGKAKEEPVKSGEVKYECVADGVKVIVTAKDNTVLPEGAALSVVKIERKYELDKIKETIGTEVAKNEEVVKDIMAFDIKFLVNGKEVQPNGEVQVQFENTGFETEENVSVYHVTDNNREATDMNAVVENEVAFDTTHFSTYVIVNTGNNTVNVTIEHWLDDGEGHTTQLYRDKTAVLEKTSEEDKVGIKNFTAEDEGYELRKTNPIVIRNGDEETAVTLNGNGEIEVTEDTVIICYYSRTLSSH